MDIDPIHQKILTSILKPYDYSFFIFRSPVSNDQLLCDIDLFFFEPIPNHLLKKIEKDMSQSNIPFNVNLVDHHQCEKDFQKIILRYYVCLQGSSKLNIIEQNHLGHFTFLPKKMGFEVHQIDGVTIMNCGLKTSMFNIAYALPKDVHQITSFIEEIKKKFHHQPFAWWIPPNHHHPQMTKAFLEAGFIMETTEHAMIINTTDVRPFFPQTKLIIKPVIHQDLLQDFITVLAPYDQCARRFYEQINDHLLQSKEQMMVGYVNDTPVTIGALFIEKNSGAIFNLMTHQSHQKKGYATDMMCFLIDQAKKNGCHTVTLSASSHSGYRIYERLGFFQIGTFECFEYNSIK